MTYDATMVVEPYWHLLDDVHAWDYSMYRPLKPTIQWLEERIRTRGRHVYLTELPQLGKDIDKSLSAGRLVLSKETEDAFGVRRIGLTALPYDPLINLIFDLESETECYFDGGLKAKDRAPLIRWNPDPTALFFLRQFLYMYKKLEVPCPVKNVRKTADAFFDIDDELRCSTLLWDMDPEFFDNSYVNLKEYLSFERGFDEEVRSGRLESAGPSTRLRRALQTLDKVRD